MHELFNNALSQTRYLLSLLELSGEAVVDATAGNGNDTLFLARLVGSEGKVYAFDIQEEALQKTERLLQENDITWYKLIHAGHEEMHKYISEEVAAIVFNLGYLPGGNKNIITRPKSTLEAVEKGLHLLKIGGLLLIVVYTGHDGGHEEELFLQEFLRKLPRNIDVLKFEFINRQKNPPYLLALRKIRRFENESQTST